MKWDKAFEILVGVLLAISLGVGGWALKSIVDHSTQAAASDARTDQRLQRIEADVGELKKGPTREEWNALQTTLSKMDEKLDRIGERVRVPK